MKDINELHKIIEKQDEMIRQLRSAIVQLEANLKFVIRKNKSALDIAIRTRDELERLKISLKGKH